MGTETTPLLLTLPDSFQAGFGTTTKSMLASCVKLETTLAEKEA